MAEAERSPLTLLPLVGVLLLMVGAFLIPWWTFEYSSGSNNPDTGPGNPGGPGEVRHENMSFYPYRLVAEPANATADVDAESDIQLIGHLSAAAVAAASIALIVELVAGNKRWSRRLAVPIGSLVFLCLATALAYTWFWLPDVLAHREVEAAFTSKRIGNRMEGFIRTNIWFGWIWGFVASLVVWGYVAAKFAGGAIDMTEIEEAEARAHKRAAQIEEAKQRFIQEQAKKR